jgi:hypothetical protein
MSWTRKLPSPIALHDGRTIATLFDARELIRALPARQQRDPVWERAALLILEASGERETLSEVATQLRVALIAQGLI